MQDQNGDLVTQTQIVETKEISSISGASFSLYVDNLSSDVVNGKLSYSTSFSMVTSSLSIYYNGLNIIKDVTIQSTNTFVIDSEYEDVIRSGDSLLAIYTVSS